MSNVTAKFIAKSKLIHKDNNGNLKFIYPDSLYVRILIKPSTTHSQY